MNKAKHNAPGNKHYKDKHFVNQKMKVFQYLQKNIATASMVARDTGIPQKNITRYKRQLEKTGHLWEIEKKLCKETGFRAWYLSADPEKAPKQDMQLKLF